MIISRTPYRVSFAGGGTDLPAYCDQSPGCVVSTAIQKYVYVSVSRDPLSYFQANPEERKECAICAIEDWLGVKEPLQTRTFHEIPCGTGLGSSSAEIVGILKALSVSVGREYSPCQLADRASHLEIEEFGAPIGRQDQYASACGGLNWMGFREKGRVDIRRLDVSFSTLLTIEERALLIYLGGTRPAQDILQAQSASVSAFRKTYDAMASNAMAIALALEEGSISGFQELLNEGWQLKRSLGCGISNDHVDHQLKLAMNAGVICGKLLGAGGTGFLFLMAPPDAHHGVRAALGYPKELPFRFGSQGSEIVYNDERPA